MAGENPRQKRKPLEHKHFLLAELGSRLGRKPRTNPEESRLTLFDISRNIGHKSNGRAGYYWTQGAAVDPRDPTSESKPFIPPTSFDAACDHLVRHAQAFLENADEEELAYQEERKRQREAARELIERFGQKEGGSPSE